MICKNNIMLSLSYTCMHAFVVIIQPILHYWIPAAGRKYGNKEQRNNWVIKGNREITYIVGSLTKWCSAGKQY